MFGRNRGGDDTPANVFQMRQSMISIGDDYWIENGAGQRAYKVDGKAFRVRKTLVIEDAAGNEAATLKEKLVSVRDVMTIERGGQTLATVKKAMFTPLRERFDIECANGIKYEVKGKITDHQYEFERDGNQVASVSKKWFRVRDSYGVEVGADEDVAPRPGRHGRNRPDDARGGLNRSGQRIAARRHEAAGGQRARFAMRDPVCGERAHDRRQLDPRAAAAHREDDRRFARRRADDR